jgi:hypothetical protein
LISLCHKVQLDPPDLLAQLGRLALDHPVLRQLLPLVQLLLALLLLQT